MADVKKSFGADFIKNTYSGRALDTVTGGALGRAADREEQGESRQTVAREGKGDKEVGLSDIRTMYAKKPMMKAKRRGRADD